MNLTLSVMPGRYAICRLGPADPVPAWAGAGDFVSVTRTGEELSIVCAEIGVPAGMDCERGWRCLKVAGPLDLSLTGVLAALAGPLAEARISAFAVSTFDTDYLLVKEAHLPSVVEVLTRSGHRLDNL